MTCYIVTFEAATPVGLIRITTRLKSLSNYCPIHENCWAVLTDLKAAALLDFVRAGGDASDRIFVIRSGTEAAWINTYGTQNSEWLKKNL